jgi:hypothetical protein
MLFDAFACYAEANGFTTTVVPSGPRGLRYLAGLQRSIVWVGSTGLSNLAGLPLSRTRGNAVAYYLHEPTTLRTKVARHNGIVKSTAWQLVQRADAALASRVVVSRPELATRTQEIYAVDQRRLHVAPLLLPPVPRRAAHRHRVTYLGRIDDRRGFGEFLTDARLVAGLGLLPTILTGDEAQLRTRSVPEVVDVHAELAFSEAKKAELLSQTSVLWNPRRFSISQSGVTADALRYGCRILLTPQDPMYAELVAANIAIDFVEARRTGYEECARPADASIEEKAAGLFSERHGEAAFRTHYVPLLESMTRQLSRRSTAAS